MATEIAGQPSGQAAVETPTDTDEFLAMLKAKETAGMAQTRAWTAMWDEALRYFLSDQLRGQKNYDNWDWVILNYIWPAIFQEMAKLARNFKPTVSPTESSDTEIAEAFGGFLQWQWKKGLHKTGMRLQQLKAILDRKLHGYSVSKIFWERKCYWDEQQQIWQGEVHHRLWRPENFWASDNEDINDGDCGTVRYLELAYAQSLWPQFKDQLEANAVSYGEMVKDGGGQTVSGQTSTTGGGAYPSSGTGGSEKELSHYHPNELLTLVLGTQNDEYGPSGTPQDNRRYVRISEQYLKDYATKTLSESIPADTATLLAEGQIVTGPNENYLTPDGQEVTPENWPEETIEKEIPVYPNGRYIVRNEDTILNPNEADQVYAHQVWPFIVVPHYLLPHMWQGCDAVTMYKNTQDHINITVSHLHNAMKEFGDPKILVENDALATPPGPTQRRFSILKGAGTIIRLARGGLGRFKIHPPVPPSPAVLALYQMFVQEYKNIQGMQDIAQGKKAPGSITATEAQFLAISSNDRIKLQNIMEEDWALQIFNLVAEMDQYYYDAGRVVRIIGEDQTMGAVQITDQAKSATFDVDIEAGEGLPWDEDKRIEKYTMAYKLLSDPNPNPLLPEMLRVLGISAWQKILAKHQAWQQFMAFQQLKEAVFKGEVAPQDAVKLLTQQAIAEFQRRGPQNGNANSTKPAA